MELKTVLLNTKNEMFNEHIIKKEEAKTTM